MLNKFEFVSLPLVLIKSADNSMKSTQKVTARVNTPSNTIYFLVFLKLVVTTSAVGCLDSSLTK